MLLKPLCLFLSVLGLRSTTTRRSRVLFACVAVIAGCGNGDDTASDLDGPGRNRLDGGVGFRDAGLEGSSDGNAVDFDGGWMDPDDPSHPGRDAMVDGSPSDARPTDPDGASDDGGDEEDEDAGSDSGRPDSGASDDCAGTVVGQSSANDRTAGTRVSGYGFLEIDIAPGNSLIALETTLAVPSKPPAFGTLFLWPGLQPIPGGKNYRPIDNGVLQPVLTWGPTCAPNSPADSYASWWVSAQYVNTYGSYPNYTGCLGGEGMNVRVGDKLNMKMTLRANVWRQTVLNKSNGNSVSFNIDMLGQSQHRAIFSVEIAGQKPVTDVIFTSTKLTFATPRTSVCQPLVRGANDSYSAPRLSKDGSRCCVSRMTLRAQGVPPSTSD